MPFVNFKKFYMRLISCLIFSRKFFFPPSVALIPAVVQVMTLQPDQFNLQQSQHPLPSCFHPWKKMSPVKVLGSRFRIFQYAPQVEFCYSTFLSATVGEREIEQLKFYTLYRICLNSSLSYLTVLVIFSICLSIWLSPPFSFCGSLIFNAV